MYVTCAEALQVPLDDTSDCPAMIHDPDPLTRRIDGLHDRSVDRFGRIRAETTTPHHTAPYHTTA